MSLFYHTDTAVSIRLIHLPVPHRSGSSGGPVSAFGNIYRSFCDVLLVGKETRTPEIFTYPTVEDGVIGIRFVNACVESN